ncbi:NinE family protein [Rosenbergiella epipactidis]|uniref:NinE family protein n=1 Tax=Rosenbergiella epipactidis TaxID=1544694 RepID=UPI0023DF815A|nr:NinE family protein [Rosenbergiella epipactidis]
MGFKSPTNIVMQNMIYDVPKPRRKRQRIPEASEVKTFDYVYTLLKSKWDRTRPRRRK